MSDDHNGISDMFLKDLSTGEVRRLSVAGSGAEANGPSTGRPATKRSVVTRFVAHGG